jgi:hypothetical protein
MNSTPVPPPLPLPKNKFEIEENLEMFVKIGCLMHEMA